MPTQEELINQQFAQARQGLGQKKKQAVEELQMGVNRRQAMGGLTGGAALKAQQKGAQGLEDVFGQNEAALGAAQAQSQQQAQAQKEAMQFQTGERESSQKFAGEQAGLGREQQQKQFESAFGLQNKQFDESRRQFDEQLRYQLKEFSENQVTNFINAMTAFDKTGLGDPNRFNQLAAALQRIRGMTL